MLPPKESPDGPDETMDTIAKIVDSLRQQFGDDALSVAENQREVAIGDTLITWGEIVARLRA